MNHRPIEQAATSGSTLAHLRRYAPLYVVALGSAAIIWQLAHAEQDNPYPRIYNIGLSMAGLLATWVLFFSGMRWWRRLLLVASPIVCIPLGIALLLIPYRFAGFSADGVPQFVDRSIPLAEIAEPFMSLEPHESTSPQPLDLTSVHDTDWPQFLGTNRDGIVHDLVLQRDWQQQPPQLLWRRTLGAGWSSFAIRGDYAVTMELRENDEAVVCYELATGQIQWVHTDREPFDTLFSSAGPRATPTIDHGRVYSIGATGLMNCLDGATGQSLWSKNVVQENSAELNPEGYSGSPLVVDQRVIVSVGGPQGRSLVAYDKLSGELLWSAGDDPISYSSPTVVWLDGQQQIVIFNVNSVTGHDPSDGRQLWRHPCESALTNNVAQPILLDGNRLFIHHNAAAELLGFKRDDAAWTVEPVWHNRNLKTQFSNAVARDGFLYGLDLGILVCLDPQTGRRRWKKGRYGHGHILLIDDLLLIQSDGGELALVEASPDAYRELGRVTIFDEKTWAVPAISGRKLLVRSEHEAAAFELPVALP